MVLHQQEEYTRLIQVESRWVEERCILNSSLLYQTANIMEGINIVVFISIYLFARLGMRLLWMVLFDEHPNGIHNQSE